MKEYSVKFKIGEKRFSTKISAINENIARQKFLQWVNEQIVSVDEYPKNNETIMDFLNGFGKLNNMNSKVIKQFYCKAHNRRIWIELHYFESEKTYLFRICTKTYKGGRDIFKNENWYTPETFYIIKDLMISFCDDEINKLVFNKLVPADAYVFNEINKHKNELKNS